MEGAIVVRALRARAWATVYVEKAVPFTRRDVQSSGNALRERTRNGCFALEVAVIAGSERDVGAKLELRLLADDVDDAGRGVLTEQGSLWTFQHLDPLELSQIAKADAVARTVYAVDDDSDGGLQAGVVADGADAANARSGEGFVRGRCDEQAGCQDREVLDIAYAGVFQQLLGYRGHYDRYILQTLFALLRCDDDAFDRAIFMRVARRLREGGYCRDTGKRESCDHGVAQSCIRSNHDSPLVGPWARQVHRKRAFVMWVARCRLMRGRVLILVCR